MSRFIVIALATLLLALPVFSQTVIFDDGFDPGINGNIWVEGPWADLQNPNPWGHHFDGSSNHLHSPPNAARASVNYRVAYNMSHSFGAPYADNVYLRAWIFEDNDISLDPGQERMPNGYVTLSNTDAVVLPVSIGEDWYRIGVRGRYGSWSHLEWGRNIFVETKTDGFRCLYNPTNPQPPYSWPRRQGWRKYAIEVYPYTGAPGDVKFYVDDTLVYSGMRDPESFVDRVIAGANVWTWETYWYEDFQFGRIQPPMTCATLSHAAQQFDGTWVAVADKVVSGRFTKNPFGGWTSVQEDDRASGLWVSTSKELNPGDHITIRGRMATSSAGKRYLDAAEVTVLSTGNAPKPLAMNGAALASGLDADALCATLWGRITGRGQEQMGDWRRYLTLECPGLDPQVRVYYGNIADTADNPVPNPADQDFVIVTGSIGQEIIGGQTINTLWIRKAGDLIIPQ